MATLVVLLASSSCKKDLLKQPPYGVVTDANYYTTVDNLNTTLTAAYSYLSANGFPPAEAGLWSVGDCSSDDANKGGGPNSTFAQIYDLSVAQQKTNNSMLLLIWQNRYNMIAACNLILDKSRTVTGDATTLQNIVNQAKFLRAYGYYQLTSLFGDVPMPLTYLDPSAVTLSRTPKATVFAQIEKDLTDASALPTKTAWGATNDGRATSGAANALLGKTYMLEGKFPQAEAAFLKVINEGTYSLNADYGAMFRKATGDNNNVESILDIKHLTNANGLGGLNYYFLAPFDPITAGGGFDEPTDDLVAEFEQGDPRIIYTMIFRGDVFPTASGTYTETNNGGTASGRANRKFFITPLERTSPSPYDEGKNNHLIRYAEVLLLYAEALNEDGNGSQALTYLNMVRARARNTPAQDPQRISTVYSLAHSGPLLPDVTTTDQTALRAAIYHEERVELAMEGLRREYLVRTNRYAARMTAVKGPLGAGTVTADKDLYPIPQNDIDVSNGKLSQNPGY